MKLLLDSHVFVWWLEGNPRLPKVVEATIRRSATWVSLASCWELGVKQAANRLALEHDLIAAAAEEGFDIVGIEADDVRRATSLPFHHSDPFDRMLVAQAERRGLVLVTGDARIIEYGGAVLPA